MPKSFNEKELQIQYMIMVCRMRGMSMKDIHREIISTLKIDISLNSLYNRLQKYEEFNAQQILDLRKSNNAYLSRIMEILNHFVYYRKVIPSTLHDPKYKQDVTPALLFKVSELLQKVDQAEFAMLEKIPDILSWKRFNQNNIGGRNSLYNSGIDDDSSEKSIDEYIISMEQIPIPTDLEELQSRTEDEHFLEGKKV